MKFIGIVFILLSISVGVLTSLNQKHLLKKPSVRLNIIWHEDLQKNVLQSDSYKKIFNRVSKFEFTSDDPDLIPFLEKLSPPAELNKIGDLKVNVHISRWFDKTQYGFVVQHNFLESHTDEKVFEFGRTYPVGYIW